MEYRKVLDAWYHPALGMIIYLQKLDDDTVNVAVMSRFKTEMQAKLFIENPMYVCVPNNEYEKWGQN